MTILEYMVAGVAFIVSCWAVFELLALAWHVTGHWPLRSRYGHTHDRMRGGLHREGWAGSRWNR